MVSSGTLSGGSLDIGSALPTSWNYTVSSSGGVGIRYINPNFFVFDPGVAGVSSGGSVDQGTGLLPILSPIPEGTMIDLYATLDIGFVASSTPGSISIDISSFNFDSAPVTNLPEPAPAALIAFGLCFLVWQKYCFKATPPVSPPRGRC
jgi:hypothetical protein